MDGTLVIEIYEYSNDNSVIPVFEYTRCDLKKCMKGSYSTTLHDIIVRGFSDIPRRQMNSEKRDEILQKLESANLGRINVEYNESKEHSDSYIELTNVVPETMSFSDVRNVKDDKDSIIIKGRYKFSSANETTVLKDAQRMTLIYADNDSDINNYSGAEENTWERTVQTEICLNITYFEKC